MYTRPHVADLLKRFLKGNVGEYEFDDFLSSSVADPEMDEIRKQLAQLPDRQPSGDPCRYTNDHGMEEISRIIAQLEEAT